MMTQELEVSILAAPLAAIDRRALSQAWYSALHLARPDRSAEPARACGPCTVSPLREAVPKRDAACAAPGCAETHVRRSVQTKPLRVTAQASPDRVSADRRAAPLSRRIERRFARSTTRIERATFSMGRGAARVHVILQTNGNVATLVALCRPEMRTVVARALAQARFALATRGFVLDLQMPRAQCS